MKKNCEINLSVLRFKGSLLLFLCLLEVSQWYCPGVDGVLVCPRRLYQRWVRGWFINAGVGAGWKYGDGMVRLGGSLRVM